MPTCHIQQQHSPPSRRSSRPCRRQHGLRLAPRRRSRSTCVMTLPWAVSLPPSQPLPLSLASSSPSSFAASSVWVHSTPSSMPSGRSQALLSSLPMQPKASSSSSRHMPTSRTTLHRCISRRCSTSSSRSSRNSLSLARCSSRISSTSHTSSSLSKPSSSSPSKPSSRPLRPRVCCRLSNGAVQ
ncbi:hypothetical protein BC831DRAFT_447927 [Entophlyctis helioformis]|nr:hypothetical protein BC831DRAFT_447927 [Entophlyctis helioformis]